MNAEICSRVHTEWIFYFFTCCWDPFPLSSVIDCVFVCVCECVCVCVQVRVCLFACAYAPVRLHACMCVLLFFFCYLEVFPSFFFFEGLEGVEIISREIWNLEGARQAGRQG